METKERFARIAPLAGVAFVVLEFAGVAFNKSMVALGDGQAKILKSFTTQVDTGVWIGAYLNVVALAAFGVFAIWSLRGRRGPLRAAGLVATGVYIATTLAALAAGGALSYGQAHGLPNGSLLVLFYLQSGLFFATWGVAAAFLLLVPASGWLRHSAVAVAALLLLALAFPTAGPAQMANMLFLIWTAVAGVAWSRRPVRSGIGSAAGVAAT